MASDAVALEYWRYVPRKADRLGAVDLSDFEGRWGTGAGAQCEREQGGARGCWNGQSPESGDEYWVEFDFDVLRMGRNARSDSHRARLCMDGELALCTAMVRATSVRRPKPE